MNRPVCLLLLAAAVAGTSAPSLAQPDPTRVSSTTRPPVSHRFVTIEGVPIFYREAGPKDAPAILLLHGFPASSHMYRNLIPELADRFHVIAPDFPGFGQSGMPARDSFAYTFAHFADITDQLTQKIGITRYSMYVMDYGAPVGYRLAIKHPERVQALIVQNGNAYEEGLREFWTPIKRYWASGSRADRDSLRSGLTLAATKWQYFNGVSDSARISPDGWSMDQAYLDREGNAEIQLDLFYDYRTNVPLYPEFQAFFRRYQPPTLIVWGKNDAIFPWQGAEPYKRDLRTVEYHLLDTGHFALEDKGSEIATRIRAFLPKHVGLRGSAQLRDPLSR